MVMEIVIVSTPDVCGGAARIKGTRIRVADIISSYKAGYTVGEIAEWYSISVEDVMAAVEYYKKHKSEIEAIIKEEEEIVRNLEG